MLSALPGCPLGLSTTYIPAQMSEPGRVPLRRSCEGRRKSRPITSQRRGQGGFSVCAELRDTSASE